MIQKTSLTIGLLIGLLLGGAQAVAGGPENAIIVVNAESASSKLIANHYISLRKIPPVNVIYLQDIPDKEFIELAECRENILLPVFKTIEKRGLANHIDYVIYSSGFPTSVKCSQLRKELRESGDAKAIRVANDRLLFPALSLTSATFFYQSVIAEDHTFYLSLNSNLYMRMRTNNTLTQPFVGKDQVQFNKAVKDARENKYDEAAKILESLAAKHPQQMAVLYWLARVYAWDGEGEKAIEWLKRSIAAGWSFREYTTSDPGFADLLDDSEFQSTLEFIPDLPFRHLTSQSFRGTYVWGPNGSINSTRDQGVRFMLSTMLGVNRNLGNSEQETLRYLRRSIAADGTHPNGTFYFSDTKKIQTIPRQPGFADAVAELGYWGFEAEIIKSVLPLNRQDVAGLMIGAGGFDWSSCGSKILPGAICESLTSWGGWLQPGTKQTKLSEFLRYGAAGSCGTIREPFAIQAKFPAPRIHVHYARGCTLAESFYQSVSGPFQLLIVGDALCQPWASIPEIEVTGDLVGNQPLSGTIKIEIDGKNSTIPINETDIYLDGILVGRVKRTGKEPFSVNTMSIPDGYHEIRIVPISAGTVATHCSNIFPVQVDNQGFSVKLETDSQLIDIGDTISFLASAPKATEIRLIHNRRIIGHKRGTNVQFEIPAKKLGRGPVEISAVATIEGEPIRSWPVQLSVNGEIASTLPITDTPYVPRKIPKKKKRTPAKK